MIYTLVIIYWTAKPPDIPSTTKRIDYPSYEMCSKERDKQIFKLDDNVILAKCYKKSELRPQERN